MQRIVEMYIVEDAPFAMHLSAILVPEYRARLVVASTIKPACAIDKSSIDVARYAALRQVKRIADTVMGETAHEDDDDESSVVQ